MKIRALFFVAAGIAVASIGCKGSPASPFNSLEGQPVTIYRVQNYQAAPAAATTPGAATSLIPGLSALIPQEFQQQASQAQSMICGFLPAGSPGCGATGATTQAIGTTTATFEGYAIIGQAQVMDTKLREQLIDIFGYEKSFKTRTAQCFFPEFGLAFGGGQTANVLVSYSCNQVQARNFAWPFADSGMTEKTVKALNSVIQKTFGG